MRRIGETLLLGLVGAFVCAILFWLYFVIQAAIDGSNVGEAAAYGLLFGVGAFLVGGVLGAFVAVLRANLLGGAALGLLAVAIFVLLWTLGQSDGVSFSQALSRSLPFAIWFAIPSLLTGLLVAWLRMRRERARRASGNGGALTPGQPV
jgi:ABC-type Fe3+ transport system permease subunit